MSGNLCDAGNAATTATFGCGANELSDPGGNPHEWLFNTTRAVLGFDAGLQLSLITGYPESSCYAYVARDPDKRRRPPEHFARALIHADEGAPFFEAFMAGCDAPWWIEHQRAADIGRKVLALTK